MATHVVKKFPACLEPECSLSLSQRRTIVPHSEPVMNKLLHYLSNININTIIPTISAKLSFLLGFADQYFVRMFHFSDAC